MQDEDVPAHGAAWEAEVEAWIAALPVRRLKGDGAAIGSRGAS